MAEVAIVPARGARQGAPDRRTLGRRVLLVEDDTDLAESLAEFLEGRGFVVAMAADGVEAATLASGFSPLMAIVDLRLGRDDGLDVIAALTARNPALLSILVTAYADTESAIEAVQCGVYDFLRKPLDPDLVVAALDRGFEQIEMADALRSVHEELEARVAARTVELESAKAYLEAEVEGRQRMAAALVAAKAEVEEASRAKASFIASMSHELRTPLNTVLGFAEFLQIQPEVRDRRLLAEPVGHILEAGGHLLRLIEQVLELSAIDARAVSVAVEDVPLAEPVRDSVAVVQPAALRHGVRIRADRALAADVVLRADPARLRQCLRELVGITVAQAGRDGIVTIDVAEPAEGRVRIVVSGTGDGVPEARWSQLLQPFQALGREATRPDGWGMGLAMTRKLAEMMKGDIGFETREGHGSTFWLELPGSRRPARVEAPTEPARPPLARGLARLLTLSGRILLVEDDAANRALITMLLGKAQGVTLFTAGDAEEGIEIARRDRPDLIILDINLPGMSGLDAARLLATFDETRDTPLLAISAAIMPSDVRRGVEAGFRRYLVKPLDLQTLVDALVELMPSGPAED